MYRYVNGLSYTFPVRVDVRLEGPAPNLPPILCGWTTPERGAVGGAEEEAAGGRATERDEGGDEGGDHELLGVALRSVVPHEDEDEDEEELIE